MTEIDRQIALRLKRTKPIFVERLRALNEAIENGQMTNDNEQLNLRLKAHPINDNTNDEAELEDLVDNIL